VVAIFHELTHRSQLVMPEEIVRLRKMRLLDVAREEHISGWRIPYLILLGRRRMTKRLSEVQVFGGMSDTIKNLQDDGYQLFIMSSNSTANVRRFLQQRELSKYFTNVYDLYIGSPLMDYHYGQSEIVRLPMEFDNSVEFD
jgi:phosphoglycolate phosphatase-like HAD superfamily hydrolase